MEVGVPRVPDWTGAVPLTPAVHSDWLPHTTLELGVSFGLHVFVTKERTTQQYNPERQERVTEKYEPERW